mmetsp:Transcript_28423/g.98161  ORF Transcript_28423/g.98161 Transcript_28423/m.98161 type:complete len:252 (+) Transcript_28423:342-1097(+)
MSNARQVVWPLRAAPLAAGWPVQAARPTRASKGAPRQMRSNTVSSSPPHPAWASALPIASAPAAGAARRAAAIDEACASVDAISAVPASAARTSAGSAPASSRMRAVDTCRPAQASASGVRRPAAPRRSAPAMRRSATVTAWPRAAASASGNASPPPAGSAGVPAASRLQQATTSPSLDARTSASSEPGGGGTRLRATIAPTAPPAPPADAATPMHATRHAPPATKIRIASLGRTYSERCWCHVRWPHERD